MKVKVLLMIFCVGISLVQVQGIKKIVYRKNEGKEKRELGSPYQFVKNPAHDYSYYASNAQPAAASFQQSVSGYYNKQPSYFDGQYSGFNGYNQVASQAFNQFNNLNKYAAAPYTDNYNYDKVKPGYQQVAYGNVQPFYNTQHSQASPYANFFQQQQVAPSYYVSQPQALALSSKPNIKVPNYALGYKGLGHYASSSPAPINEHTGLSNYAAVYQQQSAPVVSYSHSLKHPQKYNQVNPSAYIQTSFRGTNQKPFRASPYLGVNSVNGLPGYDSYGEQTITNEKPAHTYLPSNEVAQYQPAKEYLSVKGFQQVPAQGYLPVKGIDVPSKEYLPARDQTTEHHQYSTEVIPHSTERPTNYINPTKSFLQPYQNQYLPTSTVAPNTQGETAVYFSKDSYPSTQDVPQYSQQYTPQAQYYQYTAQEQESSAPDYQNPNKEYYPYSNHGQQQPQYVQFVPQDATVPIQK